MKFKPGQKLVCTANGNNWIMNININHLSFWQKINLILKGNKVLGPSYNEVVTVARGNPDPGYMPLVEYPNLGNYDERYFEPLVKKEVLENELAEIFSSEKELRQN